jgi:hypothetical protein
MNMNMNNQTLNTSSHLQQQHSLETFINPKTTNELHGPSQIEKEKLADTNLGAKFKTQHDSLIPVLDKRRKELTDEITAISSKAVTDENTSSTIMERLDIEKQVLKNITKSLGNVNKFIVDNKIRLQIIDEFVKKADASIGTLSGLESSTNDISIRMEDIKAKKAEVELYKTDLDKLQNELEVMDFDDTNKKFKQLLNDVNNKLSSKGDNVVTAQTKDEVKYGNITSVFPNLKTFYLPLQSSFQAGGSPSNWKYNATKYSGKYNMIDGNTIVAITFPEYKNTNIYMGDYHGKKNTGKKSFYISFGITPQKTRTTGKIDTIMKIFQQHNNINGNGLSINNEWFSRYPVGKQININLFMQWKTQSQVKVYLMDHIPDSYKPSDTDFIKTWTINWSEFQGMYFRGNSDTHYMLQLFNITDVSEHTSPIIKKMENW